ncbi:MAG: hypothetical protein Fur0024_2230 [Patescibacteria group bacterium]
MNDQNNVKFSKNKRVAFVENSSEKKLIVLQDACIACGLCYQIDPKHFFKDKTNQNSLPKTYPETEEDKKNLIENVILFCPTNAIKIDEEV